jgi:glycosyltransferase involved in cell wall biosynthesis
MRHLKILFISDVSITQIIGGAERVLFEQASRLVRRGHEVHILTRKLPEHKANQECIQNVIEWRYPVNSHNPAAFLQTTVQHSGMLFKNLQKQYRFDCIIFHQPFSALGVMLSPYSRGIRKIYTCHSLSFEEYVSRNPKPVGFSGRLLYMLNILLRKYIEKFVLSRSHHIIVLSRFTREKLGQVYGFSSNKIRVIPGGVDLERFFPCEDPSEIRERLNVPQRKMVLLTVRNLVQRMGLENLVLAMKTVVREIPDVYLVIGGTGPIRDQLTSRVKELGLQNHIWFAGFIPETELPEYYRMADVFILPTLELEGFGLVTLEALASGIPVLGTPVGGTLEILENFAPEWMFKNAGSEAIARGIIRFCKRFQDEPDFRACLSPKCREFAERFYSWDRHLDALEILMNQR